MEIIHYRYPEKVNIKASAVALGYFDGVHVGHRELISLLVSEAKNSGLRSYVLTFEDNIAKTKKTTSIIYNIQEKLKIFESLGVDGVIIADFSSISSLTPESFVFDVLVGTFDTRVCVAGYNFRFGKGAAADSSVLTRLMESASRRSVVLDEKKIGERTLSATVIRELLSEGRLDEATEMLGIPYFIDGEVERGLGLGKGFGFPTVNIPLRDNFPLRPGVYRTAVKVGERLYTGVTNVGSCPTVKEREIHAETMIADFEGDLYGRSLRIYFLGYLREEKLFDSVDELREQIYRDKDRSIKENGDLTWLATGLN